MKIKEIFNQEFIKLENHLYNELKNYSFEEITEIIDEEDNLIIFHILLNYMKKYYKKELRDWLLEEE